MRTTLLDLCDWRKGVDRTMGDLSKKMDLLLEAVVANKSVPQRQETADGPTSSTRASDKTKKDAARTPTAVSHGTTAEKTNSASGVSQETWGAIRENPSYHGIMPSLTDRDGKSQQKLPFPLL